ncbi:MAG: response regulator [Desulfovibrio sp.]|uniref:response regulator n=1 Tax=Desulfovibrio sp. 7SRBS1 TaxID=3378064 RepID=UPI003B4028C3
MNPRVLLVDDEKDFLATLVKRLGRRQVGAEAVTSGEEGLAFLDKHEVDVVVLDVRMPGMDGLSVLREIKRRYPLVEVIMLSGHADAQTAVQGMEMGAFDYLLKPTDIEEMVYKIEDAHAKKRLQEERIEQRKREVPS